MSKDTIIGNSPSGRQPVPDGVVPGEERPGDSNGAADVDDDERRNRTVDVDDDERRNRTVDVDDDERRNRTVDVDDDERRNRTVDVDDDRAETVPGDATTAFHRGRLYSLLALGFERPGDDFQRAIDDGALCTDLVESARAIDEDVAALALAVGTHADDADVLHDEWASLFGVEEGVTVSPYELTYLPGPLMTNVRTLADLSGFYEAFDLEIVPDKNDRRDHVCFLLEFLGQLSVREAYLRLEDDDEGVAIVGTAYRQFVEEHLGRWYWRFADEVSQHSHGFYATLGDLLAALLEAEIDRLDVDPQWVPDDPQVTEWNEDVFGESGRGCGGCGASPGGAQHQPAAEPNSEGWEESLEHDFEQ